MNRKTPARFIALLAPLMVATGVAGATTWTTAADLSANGTADAPQLVVDSTGVATAAWSWDDPGVPGTSYLIQAARRSAGATWGSPTTVSTGSATSVDLTIDGTGVVTAIWQRYTGTAYDVESARYTPGSGWGAVATVASGFASSVSNLSIAADPAGTVMAAWSRYNGTRDIVEAVRYSGSWGVPVDLASGEFSATAPSVAASGPGEFMVAWLRWPLFAQPKRISVRQYASASWGGTTDISATQNNQGAPQLAGNGAGTVVATWHRSNGTNYIIQSNRFAAGTWGSAVDLSAPGQNALNPQVAMTTGGAATAAWVRSNGSNDLVQAARYSTSTSTWGTPADLSAAGQTASAQQVSVDPAGEASAIWQRSNGTNTIIQSASTSGGVWGSASSISATGANAASPQVVGAPNGEAISVWKRTPGYTYIQSAIGANPPQAPTAASATAASSGATVQWTAPVATGGSAITTYTATASPGGATCSATAPATGCPVTGLTNGTSYTFTVTATNGAGTGPASVASAPVTPVGVPGAPTAVTATASDAQATLAWNAPADTGGSPITSYTATASPGGASCTVSAPALGCTITGLINGTAYTFTATATNGAGTGPASVASTPATPAAAARPANEQATTPSGSPDSPTPAAPTAPAALLTPGQLASGLPVTADGSFAVRIACPVDTTCTVGGSVTSEQVSGPDARLATQSVSGGGTRAVALRIPAAGMKTLQQAGVRIAGATLTMRTRSGGRSAQASQRIRLRIPRRHLAVTG